MSCLSCCRIGVGPVRVWLVEVVLGWAGQLVGVCPWVPAQLQQVCEEGGGWEGRLEEKGGEGRERREG